MSKILLFNILGNFGVRIISIFTSFLLLPLLFVFFEDDKQLGIWLTLISYYVLISGFDFGIGGFLRNKVGFLGKNFSNDNLLDELISDYFKLINPITIILLILIICFNNMFYYKCILLLTLTHFINLRVRLILGILNGIEKTTMSNFILSLPNLLFLFIVFYDSKFNLFNGISNLLLFFCFCQIIPLIFFNIYYFKLYGKILSYSLNWLGIISLNSFYNLKPIFSFFLIQLAYLLFVNTNELLINYKFGSTYVVDFQVYNRVFSIIVMGGALISSPLWSRLSIMIGLSQFVKIKKMYTTGLFITVIFILLISVFMFLFTEKIISVWLGDNFSNYNNFTMVLFLIYTSILLINFFITSFSNALNNLKPQYYGFTIIFIIKIISVLLLKNMYNWNNLLLLNIFLLTPLMIYQFYNNLKIINYDKK